MLASALEWAYQAGSALSFLCCAFAVIVLLNVVSFLDALFFLVLLGIAACVHVCCSWGRPCFWWVELNSEHLLFFLAVARVFSK